jgi:hypothetical protein
MVPTELKTIFGTPFHFYFSMPPKSLFLNWQSLYISATFETIELTNINDP